MNARAGKRRRINPSVSHIRARFQARFIRRYRYPHPIHHRPRNPHSRRGGENDRRHRLASPPAVGRWLRSTGPGSGAGQHRRSRRLALHHPRREYAVLLLTPDVRIPAEKQLLDGVTGIYVSQNVDGAWQEPAYLAPVNTPDNDGWPALSPPGTEFWLTRNCALWRSRNLGGQWQIPELPSPEIGKELHVALDELQAKRYDVDEALASARDKRHNIVAELVSVEGKRHDYLVNEYGRASILVSALSDELIELDSRIHSTEISLVDYDLAVTGERIRELLVEGRSIRNKMDALTSELRPLMVPSSGAAHRRRIVELKNVIANTRHLAQVNDRELQKAKQGEA